MAHGDPGVPELVADSPEGQKRIDRALQLIGEGHSTSTGARVLAAEYGFSERQGRKYYKLASDFMNAMDREYDLPYYAAEAARQADIHGKELYDQGEPVAANAYFTRRDKIRGVLRENVNLSGGLNGPAEVARTMSPIEQVRYVADKLGISEDEARAKLFDDGG
jgi:hypothetical protein